MSADREAWVCSGCGLVVRFMAGFDPPAELPSGWTEDGDELVCLQCRRQAIEERAARDHPDGRWARLRALAEFELRRDPSAPVKAISRRSGAPTRLVKAVRRSLTDAGELGAVPGGPRR